MNRAELIDFISQQAELTKNAAQRALEALFDGLTNSLISGNPVFIKDFGTFTIKDRAARTGRNPQTGKEIKIEATKVVGFKAGKALKEAVKKDK